MTDFKQMPLPNERIDWARISPDDFEFLVCKLLAEFGFTNIDWFRGPGDRGRDILCALNRDTGIPGSVETERWVVECKVRRSAATLTPSDINSSFAWVEANRPDAYLVVTNARATPDTKDWIQARRDHLKTKCHLLEAEQLAEQLLQHCMDVLMELDLVDSGPPRSGEVPSVSDVYRVYESLDADPTERELDRASARLDKHRDENGDLPPGSELLVLEEAHSVEYNLDGLANRQTLCKVRNFNHSDVERDRFRFYGDISTSFDSIDLRGVGLHPSRPFFLEFDSGSLVLVEAHLGSGIPQHEEVVYGVQYQWPVPMPITGARYFATYGRRPKKRVRFSITVPDSVCIQSFVLAHTANGRTRRAETSEPNLSTQTIEVEFDNLLHDDHLQLTFIVA